MGGAVPGLFPRLAYGCVYVCGDSFTFLDGYARYGCCTLCTRTACPWLHVGPLIYGTPASIFGRLLGRLVGRSVGRGGSCAASRTWRLGVVWNWLGWGDNLER